MQIISDIIISLHVATLAKFTAHISLLLNEIWMQSNEQGQKKTCFPPEKTWDSSISSLRAEATELDISP